MSAPRIPEREPIGDAFSGMVLQVEEQFLLATSPSPDADVAHEGDFVVRYGVTFLGKPHLSIVPALIALDYGAFKTGDEAWTFLFEGSNLYPRADVIGYMHDGTDEMIVVKALDLEHPLHILVYDTEEATKPIARVQALIAHETDDRQNIPERLRKHCPIFPSIATWQKARS